jgi:hypothetical protein
MKIILTAILLLLTAIPAAAKSVTAGELQKKCLSTATAGFCTGFITGWGQTATGMILPTNGGLYMVGTDSEVTVAIQRDVFLAFIKIHPEFADRPADLVLLLANGKAGHAALQKIQTDAVSENPKATKPL